MKAIVICLIAVGLVAGTFVGMFVDEAQAAEPIGPETMADPVMRINDDAELAAQADFGSGIVGDPWIICDKEIDGAGEGCGVFIGNTTEYWQINSTYIYDVDDSPDWWFYASHGIHVYNCAHGEIFNCTINNTVNYGICVSNTSAEISIHHNTIWNCTNRGIALLDTDDSDISSNTIYGNGTTSMGLTLDDLSDNHTIFFNNIDNMTICGIGANDSWWLDIVGNNITGNMSYSDPDGFFAYPIWGIFLWNSFHLDIEGNLVANASYGIQLDGDTWGAYDVLLSDNTLDDCITGMYFNKIDNATIEWSNISCPGGYLTPEGTEYGMNFNSECTDITVKYNYITDMDIGIMITAYTTNDITLFGNFLSDNLDNAQDDCGPAYIRWWNPVTNLGNWWDTWQTPDLNEDGVVDNAYLVPGAGGNWDNYPQCPTSGSPGGGGPGGGDVGAGGVIGDTTTDTESEWELPSLGIMFWAGGIILLLGLAKVPVPYVESKILIIGGLLLIVLSFVW